MLDANELTEEYMKHYECSKARAIEIILEDMDLARRQLIEESAKMMTEGSAKMIEESVE